MATIIKAAGPFRSQEGGAFNFEDVSVRAHSYLDKIRLQASEIIAQAHKDADAIRRKAEEDGRQAAIQAVEKVMEQKVGKQLATLLPAVRQAADQLIQARHAWLTHWEKAAVHLSARIASRVIRKELDRDPQIPVALVKEALELASGSADIQVRMHPDDVAALGAHVQTIVQEVGREGTARVVADPGISPGGCRLDTRFGVIDQQIESQLKRIEEELT